MLLLRLASASVIGLHGGYVIIELEPIAFVHLV